MAIQHGQFVWYELLSSDPQAAEQFYGDVLGWQFEDAQMPDMQYRMARGSEGMVCGILELTEEMREGGARPAWLGYIAVDDVDESVASVAAKGAQVFVPPTDIPHVGRFSMIADPQGVPIYLMTMAGDDAAPAYDQQAIGHCAWNELTTSDYEASIDFYANEFRWQRGNTMDMGAMGNYQLMKHDGADHAGIMPTFEAGPPPMWRYYFRVAQLAPAIEKIKSGGGTVLHGPQQVPGDDEILVALDPQSALLCLVATRG